MNIVDVLIILTVACGAVIGFKRGFFKELVMTVGFLLVNYNNYLILFTLFRIFSSFSTDSILSLHSSLSKHK